MARAQRRGLWLVLRWKAGSHRYTDGGFLQKHCGPAMFLTSSCKCGGKRRLWAPLPRTKAGVENERHGLYIGATSHRCEEHSP